MKKTISLLLSAIMLISALMANTTAYAAGWASTAKSININTSYTEFASKSDYYLSSGYGNYYDVFVFSIPINGKIDFYLESESFHYIYSNTNYSETYYYIYSVDNPDDYIFANDFYYNYNYSSGRNVYYGTHSIQLSAGSYYFVAEYNKYDVNDNEYNGKTYNFTLKYSPSISKPSSLKVTSRKATSLGLTWSKVGDIDGYQLQKKSGDSWKTLTKTTSNKYTVKSLNAGKKYGFRVRSYIDVDGTKYYSSWKTLETATKPSTPSIKAPSTNKKHQIIAKWNKVSAGSGYQVQFSKKKSFSSVIATKTVSGISKTSYTGNNFTKGRTYYVRVRAYKTVNGTKYYSSWSKTKSVKCK